MMLHTAHALIPFGYNLIHSYFRIPFNKEVSASYPGAGAAGEIGYV